MFPATELACRGCGAIGLTSWSDAGSVRHLSCPHCGDKWLEGAGPPCTLCGGGTIFFRDQGWKMCPDWEGSGHKPLETLRGELYQWAQKPLATRRTT